MVSSSIFSIQPPMKAVWPRILSHLAGLFCCRPFSPQVAVFLLEI
jgi:hypothetical protein